MRIFHYNICFVRIYYILLVMHEVSWSSQILRYYLGVSLHLCLSLSLSLCLSLFLSLSLSIDRSIDQSNILKDNFSCQNAFKIIKLYFYGKAYVRLIVFSKNLCDKSEVFLFLPMSPIRCNQFRFFYQYCRFPLINSAQM